MLGRPALRQPVVGVQVRAARGLRVPPVPERRQLRARPALRLQLRLPGVTHGQDVRDGRGLSRRLLPSGEGVQGREPRRPRLCAERGPRGGLAAPVGRARHRGQLRHRPGTPGLGSDSVQPVQGGQEGRQPQRGEEAEGEEEEGE